MNPNTKTKEVITESEIRDELFDLFADGNITDNDSKFTVNSNKTILVLSGGGVKGIAHLGGVKALEKLELSQNIHTYVGSSVGALISSLLAIGYTSSELFKFISIMDLNRMKELSFMNLLQLFGLDDGKRVEIVIKKLFEAKNIDPDITFGQLYELTHKTLIICASCLNDKRAYYFSHIFSPNMKVYLAVRMSISIPIYFAPVEYEGKLFVDGGCIDNFPIQLFNHCLDQVIALYLTDIRDYTESITNIEDLLLHTIQCLFEGVTCNSTKGYDKYVIKISLKKISMVDFMIDMETKRKLFYTGYSTVLNKFK
jgi:NTE family protein